MCGEQRSSVLVEEKINLDRLDGFAFASRKLPEYMHYRLVVCDCCGLAYANPAPDQKDLGDAYREASYDSGEEARCAARTYARHLTQIIPRLPTLEGALDIGAGDGSFLQELLAAGFSNVVGVEPSTAPIEAAASDVKGLIRQGLFGQVSLVAGEHLSLVTCFQTIEHVPNPAEMFRAIFSLLVPGGAVYVICHNRRSLSARLLGEKSPIYDIEHLQLFCPTSLRYLLESTGYHHVAVTRVINRYPLRYWARLLPLPADLKERVLLALEGALGSRMIWLPAGNMMATAFKPLN
ncbi:MAG: class I SAM-dependent methyltransferase [Actinomycetota bacterium]